MHRAVQAHQDQGISDDAAQNCAGLLFRRRKAFFFYLKRPQQICRQRIRFQSLRYHAVAIFLQSALDVSRGKFGFDLSSINIDLDRTALALAYAFLEALGNLNGRANFFFDDLMSPITGGSNHVDFGILLQRRDHTRGVSSPHDHHFRFFFFGVPDYRRHHRGKTCTHDRDHQQRHQERSNQRPFVAQRFRQFFAIHNSNIAQAHVRPTPARRSAARQFSRKSPPNHFLRAAAAIAPAFPRPVIFRPE